MKAQCALRAHTNAVTGRTTRSVPGNPGWLCSHLHSERDRGEVHIGTQRRPELRLTEPSVKQPHAEAPIQRTRRNVRSCAVAATREDPAASPMGSLSMFVARSQVLPETDPLLDDPLHLGSDRATRPAVW